MAEYSWHLSLLGLELPFYELKNRHAEEAYPRRSPIWRLQTYVPTLEQSLTNDATLVGNQKDSTMPNQMGLDLSRESLNLDGFEQVCGTIVRRICSWEWAPIPPSKLSNPSGNRSHSCTIAQETNPLFLLQVIAYQTYEKKPSIIHLRLGPDYWYIRGAVTIRTHYPEPNVAIQYHQVSSNE